MSEQEQVCNCNDEFVNEPCPVHFPKSQERFADEEIIITDKLLVSQKPTNVVDHRFLCPVCNQATLVRLSRYCQFCGVKVKIQSAVVSKYIRDFHQKGAT